MPDFYDREGKLLATGDYPLHAGSKPRKGEHRYPPLEEGEPTTNTRPPHGWTCFHCGETFTNAGSAADHFGSDPDSVPGCLLKVQLGEERGLLMALRRLEDGLQGLRSILNDEGWSLDEGPQQAVDRAWDRVHELMEILQPWRKGEEA